MGWHLTWQDPVAVALGALCLAFAWWLRRRVPPSTGCAKCPSKGHHGEGSEARAASSGDPRSGGLHVPLSATRLGRRDAH
ncbi:MAG: hypothetical protein H6745_26095 [Deltaproteobacteria bacterium]|nr:hypothetical protein [Deltaproteobacteria bacterium]